MRGSKETGYFHICTDGRALPWMFQDEEDFIAGVNRMAICQLMTGVIIVCFILMDNHIHAVLHGPILKCKEFINLYKRLTGKWISVKYGIRDHLKHLPAEIIYIADEESLLNTIAYIDRNSIVAGYRFMPREYPWGTARYMFKEQSEIGSHDLTKISDLTVRAKRELFNTRITLPDEWTVDSRGMLDPTSFIDIRRLENYFKTPARYSYFLAKKLEGIVESNMANALKTFMPDKELRPVTRQIAQRMFGQDDIRALDVRSRIRIAKELRYGYMSTLKQISRMVFLEEDILEGFI